MSKSSVEPVPMGRRRNRPAGLAASAAAGAALLFAISGMSPVSAQGDHASFQASAAAEGVRVGVAAPAFLLVDQVVDVGAPVAQSFVDSLGNSQAFASQPYPGDLVISGPGLFAGLSGLPNPGEYPFYVNSSYPARKDAKLSQPGLELVAESEEQASNATASSGGTSGDSGGASTKATVSATRDARTGTVVADATSAADAITIAGVLRIGGVTAHAKVTRTPGGEPKRESSLRVDGVSIAGQAVGLSDEGLVTVGTNTPLPDSSALAEILAQANVTVHYLAAINDSDGVISPGLVVTLEQQVPGGPNVILSYVFGRAVAHAGAAGSAATADAGAAPGSGIVGDETGAAGSEADGTPVAGGDLGAAPTRLDTGTTGTPGSAAIGIEAGGHPLSTQPGEGRLSAVTSSESTVSFYLILVVGALLTLGGGQLIRLLGVRLAWTS